MRALNNVYFNRGEAIKRYKAAVPFSFSGKRLNGGDEVFFILDGSTNEYDQMVLEIYSVEEEKFLRFTNKILFELGYLVPYNDGPGEVAAHNAIDDDEVSRIALLRTVAELQQALAIFDSPVPVQRILDAATEFGRTTKFLNVIADKLTQLSSK